MSTKPTPHLKLVGLSIWVDGRQFPNASDQNDRDWLNIRVRMEASGATVKCGGSILMASDFLRFRDELSLMRASLSGRATLAGFEPELKLTLEMRQLGQVTAEVEITPDHLTQYHRFSLDLDQSYLSGLIESCEAILDEF